MTLEHREWYDGIRWGRYAAHVSSRRRCHTTSTSIVAIAISSAFVRTPPTQPNAGTSRGTSHSAVEYATGRYTQTRGYRVESQKSANTTRSLGSFLHAASSQLRPRSLLRDAHAGDVHHTRHGTLSNDSWLELFALVYTDSATTIIARARLLLTRLVSFAHVETSGARTRVSCTPAICIRILGT